jgi:hypothetical protein
MLLTTTANRAAVPPAMCCAAVRGFATVQATAAELEAFRRRPGDGANTAARPSSLKHVDGQTLAGLLAVEEASRALGLHAADLADWGIIVSPRTPGRAVVARALAKIAAEGPWSISPHLVPNLSLHSPSGTISQLLKMHGPNLGAGGLPGTETQALLVAAALLAEDRVPGLWVVWTGWQPEPHLDGNGAVPQCLAVALALAPAGASSSAHLRIVSPSPDRAIPETAPAFSLESLHARLRTSAGPWCWSLGDAGGLEWTCDGLPRESRG